MAKNTIDSFLHDAIADHEWLEAKDKKNAPFSDVLPWEQLSNLALQWKPEGPRNLEVQKAAAVKQVANEVKRQLMLGKSLEHVKQTVIDVLSPELKTACKDELVKIAAEFPLLGSVYIEPAAFDANGVTGCEKGSALLGKNQSKLAVYAIKMSKCGGCSYNQGGQCRLYKKALVESVPYTEKTFSHYEKHLAMANKIASSDKIESKEQLKAAFLSRGVSAQQASSVVWHDESKKAAAPSAKYSAVVDKTSRDIARDLSLKLASGTAPEVFKEYVTSKYASVYGQHPEVFKKYAGYVGSLGKLFVELDPFQSMLEAKDFISRHAPGVPYVLDTTGKHANSLSEAFLGKTIISSLSQIPLSVWEANLEGRQYNAADLKANPLAVTKKAFLEVKKTKTASYESPMDVDKAATFDIDFNAWEPKKKAEVREKKASAKTVFKKQGPETVTVKNNKVSVKVDKNLEVSELESSSIDDSLKKYF
jgi:hypothetical protein